MGTKENIPLQRRNLASNIDNPLHPLHETLLPFLRQFQFNSIGKRSARSPHHIVQPHLPPTSLHNSLSDIESSQQSTQIPRTCVHRKLGGSSRITRKRYSVLQKCQVVEYALDLQERYGTSVQNVARDIQVPQNVLARWCGQVVQLREQAKIASKSLSLGAGPVGQLEAVQDKLHTWLFKKREQGMAISITHVMWKAQKFIGPDFTEKSFNAKFMVTKRWLKKFAYVYRMQTNEATRAPAVVAGEALAFLLATRPLLVGLHRD